MKKTIYFLLFMATFFAIHSCMEDEGVLTPHAHEKSQKGYKRSTISFAEMKAKLSSHQGKALSIWGNKAHKGGEEYIQEIDTTHIIQFSNDTLATYTMRVRTLDEENYAYSNLLISQQGEEISEIIVHYLPTPEWQTAHNNDEYMSYDGVLDVTDAEGNDLSTGTIQGKGSAIVCNYSLEPEWICSNGNPHAPGAPGCVAGSHTLTWNLVGGCRSVANGNGGGGNGGGSGSDPDLPTDPTGGPWGGGGGSGGSGAHTQESIFSSEFMGQLTTDQANWLAAPSNQIIRNQIINYLNQHGGVDLENGWYNNYNAVLFTQWAIGYLMNNPNTTFDELLRTRTSYNSQTGDVNNNSVGGYDNTLYPILAFPQVLQNWPSIPNVIPANEFVGWDFRNHPNWDCMDYAKEQIRIKGYQISNYGDSGQTFQIYKEQTGVNLDALSKGLSYLKYALSNGIPVIVGIDNRQGSPNPQTDNTTDHFIVIVGTGIENGEIFFRFYDNASGYPHQGTHLENKLYLDNFLNMLIGTTRAEGYRESYTDYDYIVTQIRKSKPL